MTVPPVRSPGESEESFSARKAHAEALALEKRKAAREEDAPSPVERFKALWPDGA